MESFAHETFEAQSGGLQGAISWVVQLLTGEIATSVAVLAIALLGVGMFTGRFSTKRGVSVIVGCVILFSARSIADGLMQRSAAPEAIATTPAATPTYRASIPAPLPYDPYAGAAVPRPGSDSLPPIR